ncbi:MAG: hypothetical protein NZ920_04775 [Aigarchaeota archaeon]|nr:hypothetical protein [Aigarchaeota archaeon]MDW8093253.1 hypothetical protein [Nitrososphaerota archaeon]
MEVASEEIPALQKIPKDLQLRFYSLIEDEVNKLIKNFETNRELIYGAIRDEVRRGIRRVEDLPDWSDMKIAFVDGSDTPVIDERIGLNYGLYAVICKLFKGYDPVEGAEWYLGGKLGDAPSESAAEFKLALDLVTTYYERYVAVQTLMSYDPDLIIIDGSFFGYRYLSSGVVRKKFMWVDQQSGEMFKTFGDLLHRITDLTEELINSGKAVAIVKRVITNSICGYLKYKYGDDFDLRMSDRLLLNLVMDDNELFDFNKFIENGVWYGYFSNYGGRVDDRDGSGKSRERALKEAIRLYENTIKINLALRDRDQIKRVSGLVTGLERYFLKTTRDQLPVCLEFPRGIDERLLGSTIRYMFETVNHSTGFPICFDLIDNLVSLPRGLTREFIDEIEARLLSMGIDKLYLLSVFGKVNPQKEFEG